VSLIAPPIEVPPQYALMLHGLWTEALEWMAAANGKRDAFNNPISRLVARGIARKGLDQYFDAIDALLPKAKEAA
jgi:hypothetical protein